MRERTDVASVPIAAIRSHSIATACAGLPPNKAFDKGQPHVHHYPPPTLGEVMNYRMKLEEEVATAPPLPRPSISTPRSWRGRRTIFARTWQSSRYQTSWTRVGDLKPATILDERSCSPMRRTARLRGSTTCAGTRPPRRNIARQRSRFSAAITAGVYGLDGASDSARDGGTENLTRRLGSGPSARHDRPVHLRTTSTRRRAARRLDRRHPGPRSRTRVMTGQHALSRAPRYTIACNWKVYRPTTIPGGLTTCTSLTPGFQGARVRQLTGSETFRYYSKQARAIASSSLGRGAGRDRRYIRMPGAGKTLCTTGYSRTRC